MGARGIACSVFVASILFFVILFHASISTIHPVPLFLEPASLNNLLSGQKIESSPGENFHAVALNEQNESMGATNQETFAQPRPRSDLKHTRI